MTRKRGSTTSSRGKIRVPLSHGDRSWSMSMVMQPTAKVHAVAVQGHACAAETSPRCKSAARGEERRGQIGVDKAKEVRQKTRRVHPRESLWPPAPPTTTDRAGEPPRVLPRMRFIPSTACTLDPCSMRAVYRPSRFSWMAVS